MTLPKELTTVTLLSKLLALFLFILLPFAGFYFGMRYQKQFTPTQQTGQTACTKDGKICPDGSTVGRISPNCEFAPCPTSSKQVPILDETAGWKTYRNEEYGFEFEYPDNFFISSEKPYKAYTYDLWVIFTPEEWKDKGVHNPFVGVSIIRTNLSSVEWLKSVGTNVSIFEDLSSLTKEEREKAKNALYYGVKDIQYKKTNITSDGQIVSFSEFRSSGSDYHVLMKGKNNLLFNIHNHFSPNGEIPSEIFDQILSTFKFIDENPKEQGGCVVSGCNGELCRGEEEEDLATPCIYKPEFSCYKTAVCERQSNNTCGWTITEELKACLSQAKTPELAP